MKTFLPYLPFFLSILFLAGCTTTGPAPAVDAQNQIADLQSQLAALTNQIRDIRTTEFTIGATCGQQAMMELLAMDQHLSITNLDAKWLQSRTFYHRTNSYPELPPIYQATIYKVAQ